MRRSEEAHIREGMATAQRDGETLCISPQQGEPVCMIDRGSLEMADDNLQRYYYLGVTPGGNEAVVLRNFFGFVYTLISLENGEVLLVVATDDAQMNFLPGSRYMLILQTFETVIEVRIFDTTQSNREYHESWYDDGWLAQFYIVFYKTGDSFSDYQVDWLDEHFVRVSVLQPQHDSMIIHFENEQWVLSQVGSGNWRLLKPTY